MLNAPLAAQHCRAASTLVNVGRGEHLVEAGLLAALDSGQLAAAALDAFSTSRCRLGTRSGAIRKSP